MSKTFENLETAFEYRNWKRENAPDLPHRKAVETFCAITGATYERRRQDISQAMSELNAVIGGK